MGLSPLYTADGQPLKDADGNQIYVVTSGPDPDRTVEVPTEDRTAIVPED